MRVYARYAIIGCDEETKVDPIEIAKYEPIPEEPGYVRFVGNRTVREIVDELTERLKKDDRYPDEYFHCSGDFMFNDKKEFPRYRWIACYPVLGTNEGHFIHIDALVFREDLGVLQCVPVFLGKTFQGFDFAARVATACAKHLGA
jgi:hypothetical protein